MKIDFLRERSELQAKRVTLQSQLSELKLKLLDTVPLDEFKRIQRRREIIARLIQENQQNMAELKFRMAEAVENQPKGAGVNAIKSKLFRLKDEYSVLALAEPSQERKNLICEFLTKINWVLTPDREES